MFFIPLPISEIVCFLSMIITSLYLIVGTLSNIHFKQHSEGNDKNITISHTNQIDFNLKNFRYNPNILKTTNSFHYNEFSNKLSNIFKFNKSSYRKPVFSYFFLPKEGYSKIPTSRGPPCK
jgi:hypothetical protein